MQHHMGIWEYQMLGEHRVKKAELKSDAGGIE